MISIQSLGGQARAARLTPEQRQAIARKGGCILAHGLTESQRLEIGQRLKEARRRARESRMSMLEGIAKVCATINASSGDWVIYRVGATVRCVRDGEYRLEMGAALGVYVRPLTEGEVLTDVMEG